MSTGLKKPVGGWLAEEKKKKSLADRGKSAEAAVKAVLEGLQLHYGSKFDWERNPDARSAGGAFNVRTGDFYFYLKGRTWCVEVKEVAHDFRLPAKNFSRDAIARMHKRELAGVRTLVLVHHSTTRQWRSVPIEHFFENVCPSWDLSRFAMTPSVAAIIESSLC